MGSGKYLRILSTFSRAYSLSASLASMCRKVMESCISLLLKAVVCPAVRGPWLSEACRLYYARSPLPSTINASFLTSEHLLPLEYLLPLGRGEDAQLLAVLGHGAPGDVDAV